MKIFIPYSFTWYRSWFLFSMQNEFIKMKQKSQRYCFEIERTERFELTHFFKLNNSILILGVGETEQKF